MQFLDSLPAKRAMNKILLVFIFYGVAAASFNGFFVKWSFCDYYARYSFAEMYDGTAHRPFVHRQLMITVAKEINSLAPETFSNFFTARNFIEKNYANTNIEPRFLPEYYLVYFMSFGFLLLSMFNLRAICAEVSGSKIAGTLAACVFAIIFPIFETVGGYFYDFGELFFFSLATLLAIKGHYLALILISPIAEYNKESFLFFLATLFPLLAGKLGRKKALFMTSAAIISSGLVYLKVSSIFAQNSGGAVELHYMLHLENFFSNWYNTEITYGVFFGQGMFLPHVLLVAWLVKCAWKKISPEWKNHIKIAAALNIPLYIIFCWIGELRNLSMLYVGFTAMLAIFIKGAITDEGKE